jgi:hypothetical protein
MSLKKVNLFINRFDFQNAGYLFVAGFQFRVEFLLLQRKCDLFVGGQDSAYLFRNARNREDAAQRLQRFVLWEVSFEETFHRRFAVLALNVHGLRHRSKPCRLVKAICNLKVKIEILDNVT